MNYRIRVKKVDGAWGVWIEGPLPQWMVKAEGVTQYREGMDPLWLGQVRADNLKMALVRLQHLIPEMQEQ